MSFPTKFPTKVIFIDINRPLVETIFQLFEKNPTIDVDTDSPIDIDDHFQYECVKGDITEYVKQSNTAFVSAANAVGRLGGGVDAVLRHMFPEVQPNIDKIIEENGFLNLWGEHFIPVGSSTIVPINNDNTLNQYLVTSPTMLDPSNVSTTNNCYHALYGVLRLIKKFNEDRKANDLPVLDTVICPGLGTGVGGISTDSAAKQFWGAVADFVRYDLAGEPIKEELKKMFTDISNVPSVFIKAPVGMIKLQPHYKSFVKFKSKVDKEQAEKEKEAEKEAEKEENPEPNAIHGRLV